MSADLGTNVRTLECALGNIGFATRSKGRPSDEADDFHSNVQLSSGGMSCAGGAASAIDKCG